MKDLTLDERVLILFKKTFVFLPEILCGFNRSFNEGRMKRAIHFRKYLENPDVLVLNLLLALLATGKIAGPATILTTPAGRRYLLSLL